MIYILYIIFLFACTPSWYFGNATGYRRYGFNRFQIDDWHVAHDIPAASSGGMITRPAIHSVG